MSDCDKSRAVTSKPALCPSIWLYPSPSFCPGESSKFQTIFLSNKVSQQLLLICTQIFHDVLQLVWWHIVHACYRLATTNWYQFPGPCCKKQREHKRINNTVRKATHLNKTKQIKCHHARHVACWLKLSCYTIASGRKDRATNTTNPSRITTSRDIADPLICRPRIMKNHDQWWAYTVIIHTSVACCSTVLEYKQTAETGRKEEATNARLTGVTMGSMTCRVKQPKPSPVKSEF